MTSEERRRAPRIRTYRPVRLHMPGGPKVVETLTKDLASGGVRCLSPVSVPVASELQVELVLSSGEEPLAIKTQTVWFRTIPYSDQFELGMAFRDVSPASMRRLSGYLQCLSQTRHTSTSV